MGRLLAQTVPLALGAAVSPVLLLLTLATLGGPRRLPRGAALAAGAALPLAALTVVALAIGIGGEHHLSKSAAAWVDLGLGLVLWALGVRTALHGPAPPKERPKEPSTSLGRSFALGLAGMSTNVTTIALYIPAMKIVANSGVADADKVVVSVVCLVIAMTVVLLPLTLAAVAPQASGRFLDALGHFMTTRRHAIQLVLTFGFGAYLLVRALSELL